MRTASADRVWFGLLLLFGLAVLYFIIRGPYRAFQGTVDLEVFYSASRAWLTGSDPYDAANLDVVFAAAGGSGVQDPSLNPPMTFVLLAPLAILPWSLAEPLWTVLQVAMVGAILALVISQSDLRVDQRMGLAFLTFAVALAPFHTAISQGQLTIPATLFLALGLWGLSDRRPLVTGACVALAVCLKPQMAVLIPILLILRRDYKAFLMSTVVIGVLGAISVARLALANVDWIGTLQSNASAVSHGGPVDPTTPLAHLMINLQVLLHVWLPTAPTFVLDVTTYLLVAATGVVIFAALRNAGGSRRDVLLLFAGFAALNLLVAYNRIYGATVLVFPLAWAFSSFARHRIAAGTIIAASAVFLIPGAAALGSAPLPAAFRWVSDTPLWPHLLIHQVYALVVVVLVILAVAARAGGLAGRDNTRMHGEEEQELT